MLERDAGVRGGCDYYVMTPSYVAKEYLYYLTMCGHMHTYYGYGKKRDYYPDMLIMYIMDGHMILRYTDKEWKLTAGTVALIDCQMPHHYFTVDHCEFSFAHFNGREVRKLYGHLLHTYGCVYQGADYEETGKILNSLVQHFRNEQFLGEAKCSSLLYHMMLTLFPTSLGAGDVFASDTSLNEVAQYIHHHLKEEITLQTLADQMHLSPYYFSRLFKKELGSSPYDYLLKARINRGKHLLLHTDMTIGEIASETGFASASRFTHLFTQRVGISPSEYRCFPV